MTLIILSKKAGKTTIHHPNRHFFMISLSMAAASMPLMVMIAGIARRNDFAASIQSNEIFRSVDRSAASNADTAHGKNQLSRFTHSAHNDIGAALISNSI